MSLPYEQDESPDYGAELLAFNADFTKFATASSGAGGTFSLWDNSTRTKTSNGAWPSSDGVGAFVWNDAGTVWCQTNGGLTHVFTISADFTSSSNRVTLAHPGESIYYCGGYGCITALTGHHFAQLYDGTSVAAVDVGFKPLSYLDLSGIAWALGLSGTDILLKQIGGSNAAITLTNPFGLSSTPFGLSNSGGNLAIIQGGHIAIINTSGSVLHTASINNACSRQVIANHNGADFIWIQNHKYSLIDGSETDTVTYTDWYPAAASFTYDPTNDALFGHYLSGQGRINWLFLNGIPDSGGGGGGGETDTSSDLRCWPFTLDGHQFYVLRLGQQETLVFDRLTRQWSHWQSPERINWRAHVGCNWQGMTGTLVDGGTDIVAGDDSSGVIYRLDPRIGSDDAADTGVPAVFDCTVTGAIALDSRDAVQCNAVQITLALGSPALLGSAITLQTSDDLGENWLDHGAVSITPDDFSQVVEWRGLGMMRQPGRLFQLTDNAATVRIGRAVIR